MTYVKRQLWTAVLGNLHLSDNMAALRAGGIAMVGQVTNAFIYAVSATQWGFLAPSAGRIPYYNGTTWEMRSPLEMVWPVGSIFKAVVSTNPATLIGIGTWSLISQGQALLAIDPGDPDFATVRQTGGAKTHTVTTAQLPVHTHIQDAHDHTATNIANSLTVGQGTLIPPPTPISVADNAGTKTSSSVTAVNQNAGGGGAHSNLMPYYVGYIWERVA